MGDLERTAGGACRIVGLAEGFVAGFTTRSLAPDDLPEAEAHRRLAVELGLPAAETVRVRQAHGRVALEASGEPRPGADALLGEADALFTDRPGRLLAVKTADCVPIVLADPRTGWIAAVHAGWRGTALRILDAVLDLLAARGVAADTLAAAFGPSIGGPRYEVGPEVVEALLAAHAGVPLPEAAVRPGTGDRSWLDVAAFNRAVLLARGVPPGRIHETGLCTAARPDLFASYRRDGRRAGRVITAVGRA